ncbi:hypothetical protein [Mycobacteroides abscessus]|uniref:hypothetical protein n=1 Tax=Mycobacteroides abscessus TaxID=36809 RepID=UPI0009A80786|nr:hypothetical protein [Mycobacteroides abscessus]SLC41688.1 Uncharacterised protein [Mycobacteroides abscessus subsp. abscessus]
MPSDYTDEQRYIDSEYPTDLAAKLRAADITDADDLPAWAVRELERNLYSDIPNLEPGAALAARNPAAYRVFKSQWTRARDVKNSTLEHPWRSDDALESRCITAAGDAIHDVCADYMDEVVKTYVEAVRKGKR